MKLRTLNPMLAFVAASALFAFAAPIPAEAGDQAPGTGDTPTAASTRSPAQEREELMEADRAFARDTAKKGSEAWVAWFAEDGMIVPAEGPLTPGRETVRQRVASFLDDPGLVFTWEPEMADVAAAGDMGWTVGHYRAELKRAGEEPRVQTGRYLTVWRRQADGSWRVVLDADVSRGGG